jgi:hypothetical protein
LLQNGLLFFSRTSHKNKGHSRSGAYAEFSSVNLFFGKLLRKINRVLGQVIFFLSLKVLKTISLIIIKIKENGITSR